MPLIRKVMPQNILSEAISQHKHSSHVGVTFIEGSTHEKFLSYKVLYESALKTLSVLQKKGMEPSDELMFQIDDQQSFLIIFWACILGGIIPVPLSIGQNEDNKKKIFNVWRILKRPHLVASTYQLNLIHSFASNNELETQYEQMATRTIDESEALEAKEDGIIANVTEDSIAFIQFSSGSTGSPKGVVLSHKNLITNVHAISDAAGYTATDAMLSWMPLTHDMGLIGFHINPLLVGMNQYLIPTNAFIRNPGLWIDKATEHKVSILSSPNFGYRYFLKRCVNSDKSNWDLSQVRILYNGAEPISAELCNEFVNYLSPQGLKKYAMCPVYGLAEASLAVSISGLSDEIISMHVDRNHLKIGDRIKPIAAGNADAISLVNVGRPVNHCSVRITNGQNIAVNDCVVGQVEIKGDNVTRGYYNNPLETKKLFQGHEWLNTGDMGFMKDGSLYITGRVKDIIFVNGQNYYPHDIERMAEAVEGVELNKIAVAGFFNENTKKEEIIAFVIHRGSIDKFIPTITALKSCINSKMGLVLDKVIPVKDLPKTTSGKLQRFKLIELYAAGSYREIEDILNAALDSTGDVVADKPQDAVERKVYEVWCAILGTTNITTTDNFFEVGGSSLKAAEISMQLTKEFQVELPTEITFEKQTIRELAHEIKNRAFTAYHPIPVLAHEKASYPLSSAQRRLYYQWEIDKSSKAYNLPVAFQVQGKIVVEDLESCARQMIHAHQSLRMCFRMTVEGEPESIVRNELDLSIERRYCRQAELAQLLKDLVQPFDLTNGSLFRLVVVEVTDYCHILFADFHHIISDALSVFNFLKELLALYQGSQVPLPSIQYTDYIFWERERLHSPGVEAQAKYWIDQLSGELSPLEMPCDFPRPVHFSRVGEKIEFSLSPEMTGRLRALSARNSCTLHSLLFTAYSIFLSKYSAKEDIIIGIPVSGRRHPDLTQIQGMFVNNLAIRVFVDGAATFIRQLKITSDKLSAAFHNQDYAFEYLLQNAGSDRDMSRNPVFDTMFIFQNMDISAIRGKDLVLSRHFFDPGFSKYDFSIEFFDDGEVLTYGIEYASSLFKKETILRMKAHFENLLMEIVDSPLANVFQLSLLTPHERSQRIHKFNETGISWPGTSTIHQLFEERALKHPHHTAIVAGDNKYSYSELNSNANRLAAFLRMKGAKRGDTIGVLLPRSADFVTVILGILKCGGCYLPIDGDLPAERIEYLVRDSQCKIVISNTTLVERSGISVTDNTEIISLDKNVELPLADAPDVNQESDENSLAYIIYTSGTTGLPKGVTIEHSSLVNYILWAAESYTSGDAASFPLYTSLSFDLTITSIFVPLVTGGAVIIYEEAAQSSIEKIVSDDHADIIKLTPSHLKILCDSKVSLQPTARLKALIVGGEKLDSTLARDIHRQFNGHVDIYNEYGPTEATVGCMIYKFDPDEDYPSVPIGKPAANAQIYVLDKFFQPVAAGVQGELFIGGNCLARGYLGNESATIDKFINNPFKSGQRMYRTGDIARSLPNGLIEYVGRLDGQVKINGYRIELTEVEYQLKSHQDITGALIALKKNVNGQSYLCAYYTSRNGNEEPALKIYLASRLPHYMIPHYFVRLDSFPLTTNGKVDRAALPEPQRKISVSENFQAMSTTEILLLNAWKEVLGIQEMSVTDNFFELGGDSIKAVQIASRLIESGVAVSAKDILTYHTIAQLTLYAEFKGTTQEYNQGIIEGKRNLTPIENWFFNWKFPSPSYYNQSLLFELKRQMDARLLQEALKLVVSHHDTLRININKELTEPFYNQRYLHEEFKPSLDEIDISGQAETDTVEIYRKIKGEFDLANGLLIRAALLKQHNSRTLFFITAHHLIIDGVSWRILLEDLLNAYRSLENAVKVNFPRKTASLIDWTKRVEQYRQSDRSSSQRNYWLDIELTRFTIPQDFETNEWMAVNSNTISGSLGKRETAFLVNDSHKTFKTNAHVLMNVALAMTLNEWTHQTTFVVEQEHYGRLLEDIDLSHTLGWFTALYPIKLQLIGSSIADYIKGIKEQIQKVPDHGIGYGIGLYGEKSQMPVRSEIRFNYLGQFDRELDNDFWEYSLRPHGADTAPDNPITTKIELNVLIIKGVLHLRITYNQKAHSERTISWLRDSFFTNLSGILDYIITEAEVYFTPSDFEGADLNQGELNALFN